MFAYRFRTPLLLAAGICCLPGCGILPFLGGGDEGFFAVGLNDLLSGVEVQADSYATQSKEISFPEDLLDDAPDEITVVLNADDVTVTTDTDQDDPLISPAGEVEHHASITFLIAPRGHGSCDSGVEIGPFDVTIIGNVVTLTDESISLVEEARSVVRGGQFDICAETWADFDGMISVDTVWFEFGRRRSNEQSVELCHIPPENPDNAHTIIVGESAVDAHLAHGDYLGACVASGTPTCNGTFPDASGWSTYDPGANGIGNDADGYSGAVFDGRYVYFVPNHNGTEPHGEVLRFDTTASFSDIASWTTYDAGDNGVGTDPDGYFGGVFDGRYIYFAPHSNGSGRHGEVLRLDTTGDFSDASSWSTFDAGDNGVGVDPDGYYGAVFDDRYVYFVPYHNGSGRHGEVLRYDTSGDFQDVSSWTAYDPGADGVGTTPDGYVGAAFDGRYIYFAPLYNGSMHHGEVLRYDTTGDFASASSWATYDAGENGVGTDPDGYYGATFDGQYVYFTPAYNGSERHGEVLRYDTNGHFSDTASWTTFDPGENGLGNDPDGYYGVIFDGRFVYFTPYENGTGRHGEVLRFDTVGDFFSESCWGTYDPGDYGVGEDPDGYIGAAFDGRYIYFVPFNNGTDAHGEVLRYDTTAG